MANSSKGMWRIAVVFHVLAMGAVSLTANTALADQQVQCPPSIKGSGIQLASSPPGWKLFVPDSLYLHSAAPIDGPPEKLGDLAEYTERRHGAEAIYTYRLDGNFPEGKWIKCTYGVYGEVTLSKKIEDNTAQCTFHYRRGQKAGQNDISIVCQ